MEIHKRVIEKEDVRHLIYYTFTEEEKEGKDVRTKMEPHPEAMDNNSHASTE